MLNSRWSELIERREMFLQPTIVISMIISLFFYAIAVSNSNTLSAEAIIEKNVRAYMKQYGVPGIAVGLYYKGQPFFYNFGYADPLKKTAVTADTIFEIGSITKSFTATVLAREVLNNTMQLTDTLDRSIPFVRRHTMPLQKVTLEQLATHTASLPRKSTVKKRNMTQQRVLHALLRWKPDFPLGTRYGYSNLGYNLLGYALEGATGRRYMELVHSLIIKPLGMHRTHMHVPARYATRYAQGHNKNGIPVPRMHSNALGAAGSLKSTTTDMMKFLKANLGKKGPDQLIKAMKETHTGRFKVNKRMTQALSWQCVDYKSVRIIDKNGGVTGFSTWIGFVPDKQYGLILLSNRRNPRLTALGRKLLRELASAQ